MWATDFFRMSLQGTAFGGLEWMQWWTYFMMAWWVSWGAFVGVFLARISRGRTIRGFIVGVLVVPSLVFFTWFTVFGGTAIHIDMFEGGDIAKQTAADINSAFFATLDHFPFATVTSVVAIILVLMFFISGADANTYVLSMMTSGGSLAPHRAVLILWGVLTGVTAVVLMLAGGLTRPAEHRHRGLTALPGDHRRPGRVVLEGTAHRYTRGRMLPSRLVEPVDEPTAQK